MIESNVWQEKDISYLVSQISRNRGVIVQDDTKQIEKVMAKRTAKNSVFLDFFQSIRSRNYAAGIISNLISK